MKPHLPSALRRALLACCALSVGFTLSSGIAAADTTLGKTDTITIDYAASSTQTPLDADGVLTLTGDTKLMLLNMGDITGFSYTLCTGVSGLQTADGELTLTTGNNSAEAYFDTTAPGSSIWADASLQWVSDRLLLVLNNTRVKDSVTITERQTGSVDYQEYKGVSFESITGGAIYGSTITLNGNGNVEFIKNQGSRGSAIYGNTIELNGNESVKFSENNSPDSSTIEGSRGSRITISDNGRVEFSKNHGARGGAFYSPVCQLSMCNNDSVTFIENTTGSIYDVIGLELGSTISLNHNGSISFIRNTAANALSSYMEELSLSHNGSVTFEENKCRALLANYKSTIKLSNNGSVSICRNKGGHGSAISVEGDVAKLVLDNNDSVKFVGNIDEMERYNWGVLYGRWGSTIIICNNREVLFEKNITNRWSDNNIFLRSIYSTGELGGLATLVMGAPENGNITFSDSIYADGVVELNAAYDHDGDASTDPIAQCGTITFTGEQAEADLKSYLDDNNITLSTSKLASAIRQSKTSTLNATTTLYDGTLEVKKGAILVVGNTLTVNDGATLAITDNGLLRNCGTLTLNGKTILGSTISNSGTVKLGGTIDISGITPYETGISVRVNEFGYEGTRSGFLREGDCRIKVVDGGTIEDTGATIDYNGEVMTGVSTLADGIVQVKTQDINYREYLLENTDNATYSNIATASGGQLERISLRGGILNLDSSLDSGVTLKILGDIRQSIDMWENVVLSKGSLEELSDSRELIISGKASSVYEITGELGLGAGVSLKDWNGTVRATDTTLSSGGVDTTEWKNTELKGVTTVQQGATLTLGGNVLLCGKISNSGTLVLGGNIAISTSTYADEDVFTINPHYQQGSVATEMSSGFLSLDGMQIQVVTGNAADDTGANWSVTGVTNGSYTFDEATGKLHVVCKDSVGTAFYINTGDSITYDQNTAMFENINGLHAEELVLSGGDLSLSTELANADMKITAKQAGNVEICDSVNLNASQLDASAAGVVLSGGGSYTMVNVANTLGSGVSVGSDWSGTVNTTGDTTALELDKLGVSGSKVELGSDSHTLVDRNQSVAADLNSTGSVSLTGKELTLSGNNTLGSVSVGSLVINGGSTAISHGLTTAGESSVADGASLSIDGASAIGGKITLGTGSTLTLDGTIKVNKDSFAPEDAVVDRVGYFIGSSTTPNSTNSGFEAACWDITIAEGGTITDNGADWQLVGDADADFSFEADGTLHAYGSDVGSVFHVAAGDSIIYGSGNEADFTNSKGTEATCISLNGGTLVLNTGLRDNREDYVKSTAASTVEIGSGVELSAAQLDASAADVTLAGEGGYTMESGANTLGEGVSVGSDWRGTVNTTGDTTALELDSLGVSGSKVELGSDSHTLADRNQSVAADLNSTGSVSLTGKELTLSGNNTLGSLSVGSLVINGGSTAISDGLTTDSISGTVSVTGGTLQEATAGSAISTSGNVSLSGVTLGAVLNNSGTLSFAGNMTLDTSLLGASPENENWYSDSNAAGEPGTTGGSGFRTIQDIYTVVTGATAGNTADWQLTDGRDAEYAGGKVLAFQEKDFSTYWVNEGSEVSLDNADDVFTADTTTLALNGGKLVVDTNTDLTLQSHVASAVEIADGSALNASQLDASAAGVVLSGGGSYTMVNVANTLGSGVSVGSDWSGTVNTTGDTTALELDKLGVSGSKVELGSDSHTLVDRNQSVAADLNSTGSVSLTGKELTLSGNNTLGSVSVGSLVINGGSTAISHGLTTAGESSVADGASLSIDGASAIGGKITLGTGSTLTLDGTIKVNKDSFAPEDAVVDRVGYFIGSSTTPNSTNSGFEAACWDITIAEGGTITDNGADWQLVGDADADFSFEADGTLHAYGSDVGSVFHVAAGDSIIYGSGNEADFTNSKGTEATCISLNGGTLVLNTGLRDNREDYVKSTAASTVEIGSGVELSAAQLDASAADVTLAGEGGYTMESGANTLGEGVSVGSDWSGKVSTTGDTTALELDSLGVSGSKVELGSDSHTLADRNQSVAADLNSTGSVSLTGKELTLSGNNTLGSVSVGSLVINGGSTAISHGLTTAGESSVADGASLSIDGASAIGGKITLGTGSTLTLDGTIKVNKDSFAPEDAVVDRVGYFIGSSTTPNSTNSGFEAACWDITIAEGGTITDNGADWQLVGDADADFSFEADGTLHAYGSDVGSVFHVAAGDSIIYGSGNEADFTNSKGTEATCISLNGGTLVLNTGLRENREDYVKSTAASTVEIGNGVELKAAQLDASAADVTLAGTGGYDLESGSALAGGVKLGSGWKGTVYTGAIAAGTESLDVNHLGNEASTVQLGKNGDASMNSLTADAVGTVVTPGALSLMSQTSQVRHLTVKGGLTLGSADAAATLIATGALSTQGITLGNIGSTASAAMLLDDTLNLTVADSELLKLTGSTTVLTLGSAYAGTTTLNGEEEVLGSNGKMIYTLVWQTPVTRAAAASSLVLQADTNPVYVKNTVGKQVKHHSYNGRAGLRILNAAYAEHNPQQNAAGGALAGLIDTVDAGKMTDRDLAAVAGASTAVLGQALSGDVERQLRAIRNRAAMGNLGTNSVAWDGKGGLVSTSLPSRYFAWVNAEGNRAEQNADGTAPGYTLNSWGGTVGAGMQVNSNLTMGLSLSAMYGDLRSDGPDSLDGDMDTTYLSAFACYESGKWSHAFIGTAGTMETDYKRTVSHATDSYHTYGDTDGTAFGLMYEVSRDFILGSKGTLSPVFNISYRHAEVDGYSESGADAALSVGEQSLDTMTLGLGARYAAVVGERAFNRACAFEARALAKYDFGDTQNNIGVGFVNQATHANIESAEMGAFGVELGAGISVPVGKGSIFADGAVELRSDYTNFNATVGYKIQF